MKIDFRNTAFRRATSRSGFTLVEIMIVVLIIGLLAMIAIPNVKRALEKARLQAIKVNLRTIDNVKTQWAAENKKGGNEVPSEADLAPYFNGSKFPSPVVGETYQINAVDAAPLAVTPSKLLDIPQGGTITMDDAGPGK
ncbi:MAG: prepilin-type N-terminal cleavage/methylation domain-containing protein [Verrucomicrobia bacterium]|nr:MAG: prepilin-type N-terminal cleavage/methylation domain-containing protein [Verrucomicrobiota bacterium]